MTNFRRSIAHPTVLIWITLAFLFLGGALTLTLFSSRFGYDYRIVEMPVLWLAGGLIAAGLIYQALPYMVLQASTKQPQHSNRILIIIIAAGLGMRVLLLASEPTLEDDYQRYLWDGAVTAHGISPYKFSPSAAIKGTAATPELERLVTESGQIVHRVNHPDLRTIYPPVAQGVFAFVHWIAPWSLTGWRFSILAFEIVSLALIIQILISTGRSPLWSALYWWNPVVIKELFNSAHMEAILVPLVLGALLLAIKKRFISSAFFCALAAGTKIWPVLLLPLLLRPLCRSPRALALPVIIFSAVCLLAAIPVLLAGLDQSSGFVAYAQKWQTNSALTPALDGFIRSLLETANLGGEWSSLLTRICLGVILLMFVIFMSIRDVRDPHDLIARAGLIAAATLLLSPAQFPWYFLWVAPFLPILPLFGLTALTATLPLYYTAFHYQSFGNFETFKTTIAWLIWSPAWCLLTVDFLLSRLRRHSRIGAPAHTAGDTG
ncbi:hypothetical protein MnTg02_02362 [bacterium MnTg02]|nr:hypothetical protein MnTg02_02362 [bacterium MnTg02]